MHGLITCKKEGESTPFTDFDNVLEGSFLVFVLSSNDKATHKSSFLTIGKKKYVTLNGEGSIEGRLEVIENNVEVKGECVPKEVGKKWNINIS